MYQILCTVINSFSEIEFLHFSKNPEYDIQNITQFCFRRESFVDFIGFLGSKFIQNNWFLIYDTLYTTYLLLQKISFVLDIFNGL